MDGRGTPPADRLTLAVCAHQYLDRDERTRLWCCRDCRRTFVPFAADDADAAIGLLADLGQRAFGVDGELFVHALVEIVAECRRSGRRLTVNEMALAAFERVLIEESSHG